MWIVAGGIGLSAISLTLLCLAGSDKGGLGCGIAAIIFGISLFLWAVNHSPNTNLGEMFFRPRYYLEPWLFNGVIVVSAFLGLGGAISIVRALQSERGKGSRD